MSKHAALTTDELKQAIKDAYQESSELGRREYYLRNRKKCVSSALGSLREPLEQNAALWDQAKASLKEVLQHMETEIRLISPMAQAADTFWRELLEEEKLRNKREQELRERMIRQETIEASLKYDQEHSRSCHCHCH